ncbi:MAG: hypothetical protein IIA62_00930 [Nitrospinae bacterium]|nr:hypothetical protein [Nitrospinota bacterium]
MLGGIAYLLSGNICGSIHKNFLGMSLIGPIYFDTRFVFGEEKALEEK